MPWHGNDCRCARRRDPRSPHPHALRLAAVCSPCTIAPRACGTRGLRCTGSVGRGVPDTAVGQAHQTAPVGSVKPELHVLVTSLHARSRFAIPSRAAFPARPASRLLRAGAYFLRRALEPSPAVRCPSLYSPQGVRVCTLRDTRSCDDFLHHSQPHRNNFPNIAACAARATVRTYPQYPHGDEPGILPHSLPSTLHNYANRLSRATLNPKSLPTPAKPHPTPIFCCCLPPTVYPHVLPPLRRIFRPDNAHAPPRVDARVLHMLPARRAPAVLEHTRCT
jgi:hypothetical protein